MIEERVTSDRWLDGAHLYTETLARTERRSSGELRLDRDIVAITDIATDDDNDRVRDAWDATDWKRWTCRRTNPVYVTPNGNHIVPG